MERNSESSLANLDFDVLVVGSGLGAGASALTLAKAGKKVLVLERGHWPKRDAGDWDSKQILVNSRYKGDDPVEVNQYSRGYKALHFNENVGGMSVFYGGAAFRFREKDFQNWPLKYRDFESFYGEAESDLCVHGAGEGSELFDVHSPFRSREYPYPNLPLTQPSRRIFDSARKLGLRPSAVPMALNFSATPVCIQCLTCDGFPCKISAKSEAITRFLMPATKLGAKIITGVEVQRLEFSDQRVEALDVWDKNKKKIVKISLEGRKIILSAGAIGSPVILLRSNLEKLQNSGNLDLIGRNLMRHANAVVAGIFFKKINPNKEFQKQIAIFDFYESDRGRSGLATGVIQDIYTPPAEALRALSPWGLKTLASEFQSRIQNLLCIAEDEAQYTNFVGLSDSLKNSAGMATAKIFHSYSKSDLVRRNQLIKNAKNILRTAGAKLFHIMEIDSFSHALGTLRFGNDPKSSVLDPNCKFWGLENLWVLDASFMPSSAGVNPSLTLVANALRVASNIH